MWVAKYEADIGPLEKAGPVAAQQEPVNQRAHELALRQWEHWKQYALELQERLVKYEGGAPMVLNAAPQPAQRTWVGLTEEEKYKLCRDVAASTHQVRTIEAKLKEKNT